MRLKVQLNLLAVGVVFTVGTFVSLAALVTIDRLAGNLSERLMQSEIRQMIQRFEEAHRVLRDTGVDTIQSYIQRTQVDFLGELKAYRLGDSGRLYIVSTNQKVLLAADDRSVSDVRWADLDTLLRDKAGTASLSVAGKDSVVFFDTFPEWGWKVLLTMSKQEIHLQRDQFLRMVMVIFFISVVLGVFVFAWVANGFVKPILMLSDQLSSMTSETLGDVQDVPRTSSEVQRLIDSFKDLSGRLNSANLDRLRAQRDVEQLNAGLEKRVEERTLELEKMNQQLQTTVVQLQNTREELVNAEKLASLGSLVAGVAHELNTPIGNAVLCASTLTDLGNELRRKIESGLRRSDLEHLLKELDGSGSLLLASLERAALLVRSFKEVAVDRTSERRRVFSLRSVVNELVVTCSHEYKNLPYKINVEVDPGIELDSYPGPLGQVIMNLLRNAVIHGFDGLENGQVMVRGTKMDHKHVLLEVVDNGRGIPAENRKRVFEPFFTTKLGQGGSGLGLHVAYNIVNSVLGGDISLEDAEGGGARFKLILPVQAPAGVASEQLGDIS